MRLLDYVVRRRKRLLLLVFLSTAGPALPAEKHRLQVGLREVALLCRRSLIVWLSEG